MQFLNHRFLLAGIVLLLAISITGCGNRSFGVDIEKTLQVTSDFSNILNLHGIPDSSTDRSVFIFSDLGAWHGYSLPAKDNTNYRGSFVGPYIMTQDNGIWLSKCLSKFELRDLEKNIVLDLKNAEIIESNSYPNKLRQIFKLNKPNIKVKVELVFASNRTAITQVEMINLGTTELNLAVRWSSENLFTTASFGSHEKGVKIEFEGNENVGWVSTDKKSEHQYRITPEEYSLEIYNPFFKPNDTFQSYLSHTFCFSEEERISELPILSNFYKNSENQIKANNHRWDQKISKIFENLRPEFNSNSHRQVVVKCLLTLNNNWKSAAGALKHDGLFPSYNYEWFNGFWSWDSWKHAVAIAKYDTDLAQEQIRTMYHFQDEMGMIADCVYRDNVIEENNWRDTKPPLSAWAVWEVYQRSKDKEFLKEMFPKIEQYHNWWYEYRDINSNGLCEYGSTDNSLKAAKWESGMDNAVRFDDIKMIDNGKKGGSMNCESVDLNSYLYAEKKYLAKITGVLGMQEKAKDYLAEASKLQPMIIERFYSEEKKWFFDFSLESNNHIEIYGSEGWIPLWANLASKEQAQAMKSTLLDPAKFATHVPFPTLAADHPKFTPKNGYWRGPVWLDQAYFAIQGLRNYNYEKEAMEYTNQLINNLEGLKDSDLPIRENYHPLTGEGLESNHFSWSAAHLIMLMTDQ